MSETPQDREKFFRSHQGLVYTIARRYSKLAPLDDLMQEGNMGLMRARELFNPAKSKWSTYASIWVNAKVKNYISQHSGTVREYVRGQGGRGATHKARPAPMVSIDARFEEGMPDDSPSVVAGIEAQQLSRSVRESLKQLSMSPLSRAILERRLLTDDATLNEIGAEFGCSRENVRQVEKRLLNRLRGYLAPLNEGWGEVASHLRSAAVAISGAVQ